jgi:hypothetical protein
MDVDANLYEFLKENETGMHSQGEQVIVYVHIPFYNLKEFVEIVGDGAFDEGGLESHFFRESVCVELNDIIENDGHNISSYKKCFDPDDWKRYEDQVKKMELE